MLANILVHVESSRGLVAVLSHPILYLSEEDEIQFVEGQEPWYMEYHRSLKAPQAAEWEEEVHVALIKDLAGTRRYTTAKHDEARHKKKHFCTLLFVHCLLSTTRRR